MPPKKQTEKLAQSETQQEAPIPEPDAGKTQRQGAEMIAGSGERVAKPEKELTPMQKFHKDKMQKQFDVANTEKAFGNPESALERLNTILDNLHLLKGVDMGDFEKEVKTLKTQCLIEIEIKKANELIAKGSESLIETGEKRLRQLERERDAHKEATDKFNLPYVNFLPYIDYCTKPAPDFKLAKLIPRQTAIDAGLVVFSQSGNNLEVAVADPHNTNTTALVEKLSRNGYTINISLCSKDSLNIAQRIYSSPKYQNYEQRKETKKENEKFNNEFGDILQEERVKPPQNYEDFLSLHYSDLEHTPTKYGHAEENAAGKGETQRPRKISYGIRPELAPGVPDLDNLDLGLAETEPEAEKLTAAKKPGKKLLKSEHATYDKAKSLFIPYVHFLSLANFATRPPGIELAKMIPKEIAKTANAVIFEQSGKHLKIAVTDPSNAKTIALVEKLKQDGNEVTVFLCSEKSLKSAHSIYNSPDYTKYENEDGSQEAVSNFTESFESAIANEEKPQPAPEPELTPFDSEIWKGKIQNIRETERSKTFEALHNFQKSMESIRKALEHEQQLPPEKRNQNQLITIFQSFGAMEKQLKNAEIIRPLEEGDLTERERRNIMKRYQKSSRVSNMLEARDLTESEKKILADFFRTKADLLGNAFPERQSSMWQFQDVNHNPNLSPMIESKEELNKNQERVSKHHMKQILEYLENSQIDDEQKKQLISQIEQMNEAEEGSQNITYKQLLEYLGSQPIEDSLSLKKVINDIRLILGDDRVYPGQKSQLISQVIQMSPPVKPGIMVHPEERIIMGLEHHDPAETLEDLSEQLENSKSPRKKEINELIEELNRVLRRYERKGKFADYEISEILENGETQKISFGEWMKNLILLHGADEKTVTENIEAMFEAIWRGIRYAWDRTELEEHDFQEAFLEWVSDRSGHEDTEGISEMEIPEGMTREDVIYEIIAEGLSEKSMHDMTDGTLPPIEIKLGNRSYKFNIKQVNVFPQELLTRLRELIQEEASSEERQGDSEFQRTANMALQVTNSPNGLLQHVSNSKNNNETLMNEWPRAKTYKDSEDSIDPRVEMQCNLMTIDLYQKAITANPEDKTNYEKLFDFLDKIKFDKGNLREVFERKWGKVPHAELAQEVNDYIETTINTHLFTGISGKTMPKLRKSDRLPWVPEKEDSRSGITF